jgi:hypothetical protein
MLWIADQRDGVVFLKRNEPARLQSRDHLLDDRQLGALREVQQHKPLMHQIELFARLAWSERVALDDADVLQASLFDLPASQIGEAVFALDSDDFAFRADTFGQKLQYSDRPTTYIRNTPTRFDPQTIQQPASLRFERFSLIDQTLLLGSAAAEHIFHG